MKISKEFNSSRTTRRCTLFLRKLKPNIFNNFATSKQNTGHSTRRFVSMHSFIYVLAFLISFAVAADIWSCCLNEQNQLILKPIKDTSCVSWGFFDDTIDKNGWGNLKIWTNAKDKDDLQMRAAGFLEGFVGKRKVSFFFFFQILVDLFFLFQTNQCLNSTPYFSTCEQSKHLEFSNRSFAICEQ